MVTQLRNVHWLWLSLVFIIADQVTKQMVVNRIDLYERVVVTPWLNFKYAENYGAAFSMLSNLPPWVFVTLGVAVSIGIVIWLRSNPVGERLVAVGLCLILGGALGNVIDRATRGYVVDFIDFHVQGWHFATFNVADIAITIGAGFLILDMILQMFRPSRAEDDADPGVQS